MSFIMPLGCAYDGSQSKDSVTFAHADHSASDPHFTIVDRKAPLVRNGSQTFAQYRVRTFQSAIDSVTGEVGKSVVETNVRYPAFAAIADVKSDVAFHASLAATANFQTAVEKLILPYTAATS